MSNNNTLFKALTTFIKNKFTKSKKEVQTIDQKILSTKKKSNKANESKSKGEINEEKFSKLWLKKVNKTALDAPRIPLRRRIPEIIGALSICLTLITSVTLLTVISSSDSDGSKAHDTNITKIDGDAFAALNANGSTERSFQYYDNLLQDGELNFMTTKNISATGKYGTDVFLARNKKEQYEFLRNNNNTIFLAWVIRQNSESLFPDYQSAEIEIALNTITENLYTITLRTFLGSNTTSINNYFQSLGYEDRDDYVERKLKPRAYLYFYLIDRMAKTPKTDTISSFNAQNALTLNTYFQVWGSKISKNYKELSEKSSDFVCGDLGSISAINPPTNEQWLKMGNCKYINGDPVYGRKSVAFDVNELKTYSGYLGPMTRTDSSWITFCNFVSAQICQDLEYDPSKSLIEPIYNMFLALLANNSSFLSINTYDVGLEEVEANGKDTLLIPYENYYLIFKTSKILPTDVYEEDSTNKLDVERGNVIESLVNFLNNTRDSSFYRLFCNSNTAADFSNTQPTISKDVEVYIFDIYTSFVFDNLCSKGVIF